MEKKSLETLNFQNLMGIKTPFKLMNFFIKLILFTAVLNLGEVFASPCRDAVRQHSNIIAPTFALAETSKNPNFRLGLNKTPEEALQINVQRSSDYPILFQTESPYLPFGMIRNIVERFKGGFIADVSMYVEESKWDYKEVRSLIKLRALHDEHGFANHLLLEEALGRLPNLNYDYYAGHWGLNVKQGYWGLNDTLEAFQSQRREITMEDLNLPSSSGEELHLKKQGLSHWTNGLEMAIEAVETELRGNCQGK